MRKKILLACDLDNTLIHSFRHPQPGDVCIEWRGGAEQSYITAPTLGLLERLWAHVLFVPVTSRSVEQYRRIQWPEAVTPPLALTTNGAVCLWNGEPDAAWQARSAALAARYEPELASLREEIRARGGFSRCSMVDGMFLYVHYESAELAAEQAAAFREKTAADVLCTNKKVYFFPPGMDKGTAVRALMRRWPFLFTVCAGDSEIDLPMLEAAGLALVPNAALAGALGNPAYRVCPQNVVFSEFVLETVRERLRPEIEGRSPENTAR